MIPLVDDFLLQYTARNIHWLKHHPSAADMIFYTSTRETVDKLKKFLTTQNLHVVLGYPRDQTALPAFAIVMEPESEAPLGIGDELGTFSGAYLGTPLQTKPDREFTEEERAAVDYAEEQLGEIEESTGMRASYRIECWADNADLVSYMYAIAKWSLWGCRNDMYRLHWTNILLSGMDLEPMTEYMPVPVYRRALQISLEYENQYYTDIEKLGKLTDIIRHPEDHTKDPEILEDDTWVLCPHYYSERISGYAF